MVEFLHRRKGGISFDVLVDSAWGGVPLVFTPFGPPSPSLGREYGLLEFHLL